MTYRRSPYRFASGIPRSILSAGLTLPARVLFLLFALALPVLLPPWLAGAAGKVVKTEQGQTNANTADYTFASDWEKRWWLDRVARLLRAGEGLSRSDDIASLLKLPREDAIRHLMDDIRFGDAMLDFNLFFLGFKPDRLKAEGVYTEQVFDFPNAISSAKAIVTGGDYLQLFDLEGKFYPAPLRNEPVEDELQPEDAQLDPQKLREKAMNEVIQEFGKVLRLLESRDDLSAAAACSAVDTLVNRDQLIYDRFYRAFSDSELFGLVRARLIFGPLETLAHITMMECGGNPANTDILRLHAAIDRAIAQFERAFAEISRFEPEVYQPGSILQIKPFEQSALPYSRNWIAFGYQQASILINSSTNFNRKRAAYVLKRYFCDDLNPVGFEAPMAKVEGNHGSDSSCYACHYKLDPMAGFFRNYGALFSDATRFPDIVFDDLASSDRRAYTEVWQAKPGSNRQWGVGYIRSPRWEERNSYGESISDLARIIRAAPEAQRCIVKRFVEYAVGDQQMIGRGYLDALSKQFDARAKENSSEAMKELIVSVLTSNTFMERNPDPNSCYDMLPDDGGAVAPPCRVAFILDRHCSKCHNSPYAGDGNLDLTSWTGIGGQARSFPHLDKNMEQVDAEKTLATMLERLSTTDDKRRMPKNKVMSSQDRQELYLWAQEELKSRSKEWVQ